jgi:hypothetical protein
LTPPFALESGACEGPLLTFLTEGAAALDTPIAFLSVVAAAGVAAETFFCWNGGAALAGVAELAVAALLLLRALPVVATEDVRLAEATRETLEVGRATLLLADDDGVVEGAAAPAAVFAPLFAAAPPTSLRGLEAAPRSAPFFFGVSPLMPSAAGFF